MGITAGFLLHRNRDLPPATDNQRIPDLVVAFGGRAPDRFSLAVKALGGLPRFSFKGKKILVKPAMKWNKTPGRGVSTDPELVFRIIEDCYEQEASGVYILEHTVDEWRECYKNSGIEEAAKRAYGKIVPANEKNFYKSQKERPSFHERVGSCDALINVSPLYRDGSLQAGIANLEGLTWENGNPAYSLNDYRLHLLQTCQPALTIIDTGNFFEKNKLQGAWLGKIGQGELLIASPDPVLAESFVYRLCGIDPASAPYLLQAEQQGLGSTRVGQANLRIIELG